jgi:biopolymer transport protein ExbB
MKRIALLSLATISLWAEPEPITQNDSLNLISLEQIEKISPDKLLAEETAGKEIETFFQIDENPTHFNIQSPNVEVAEQKSANQILLAPSDVPSPTIQHNNEVSVENRQIVLDSQAPKVVDKELAVPPVEPVKANSSIDDIALSDAEIAELEAEINGDQPKATGIMIDLRSVFSGSPTIYTVLMLLSIGSFCVWLYTFLSLRSSVMLPGEELKIVREKIIGGQFDEAINLCKVHNAPLFKMIGTAVSSRSHGRSVMQELMKSEGRRSSASLWQKIAILNDVAIIAPMLGLLGTVLGMFYAFYDLNRSMESISALFDGLGISVGTTVAGLVVAIVAMFFHSMTKYRLIRQLNAIENEAVSIANLIGTTSNSGGTP